MFKSFILGFWLFMAARSILFIRRFAGHRWQVVGAER